MLLLRGMRPDDEVAEPVVSYASNVPEYDVLDHFPLMPPEARAMVAEAKQGQAQPDGR